MRSLGKRTRRGIPLWVYLVSFVMVPQAGLATLAGAAMVAQYGDVQSARQAEAAIDRQDLLGDVRSSVEQEIVPALARSVLADPAIIAQVDVPAELLAGAAGEVQVKVTDSRATTDAALAALPSEARGSEPVRRAEQQLSVLRSALDAGDVPLEDTFFAYVDVSNVISGAQTQAATDAMSEQVSAATLRATHDVEIVSELAQASAQLFPLFLAAQFDSNGLSAGSPVAVGSAWLVYQDARRRMADLSAPTLVQGWESVQTIPAMASLDELLTDYNAGTLAPLLAGEIIPLFNQAPERDAALNGLVAEAAERARTLAVADESRAKDAVWLTLKIALSILVAGAVIATVIGLRLRRGFTQLTAQADRVSDGSLVHVRVDGPREVRTISAALGSTVASLRRVQAQAAAVARGDLDDLLLDEPLPGPLGEVVHASVRQLVNSVREREELQVALAHRATHDPLTELPNRAQARALVHAALHRGQRSGEMTGLLFIDLDGFKGVNDTRGHAAGDEVLRVVSRRMRAVVRPGDAVCRLGGDEFVVLMEQVHTERDLLDLAERLIAAVSEPIVVDDHEVRVGASVGVAVSRDGGTDADVLFAEADTATYRAKALGRGRAEIFDEVLRHQLTSRVELEAAVSAALENGEMQLHYQPVVDIDSGRLSGYEALLRWHRPGVGVVAPDTFIPVAEASPLICDIDRWVLREATRQLVQWRVETAEAGRCTDATMAVNISGRHLCDPRVVDDVAGALADSGLPGNLLVLEVTETVLVNDPIAIGHLTALRALGVGIAIDDFGTGYTSIGQLRHMPVDTLKIDRSFVASADPGNRELVSLMIRAAHTFGLSVVAEGVEESGQLARLREDLCDHAQGYLLHRPLPAAEAGALLDRTAVPAER